MGWLEFELRGCHGCFAWRTIDATCFDSDGCGVLIAEIDSFQVFKIGDGRELASRTRPAFGSIAFKCRELKELPRSTFGGK